MPNGNHQLCQILPSKQETRDIIETTATLPPRLLNAESDEKESLQAAASEPLICICKIVKSLSVKTVW
jgi:hypothetical protein